MTDASSPLARGPDRREFLALGVGLLAVAAAPRAHRRAGVLTRARIPVMGTVAEVAIRHPDGTWARRAAEAAFAELRRVDRTMSRFRPDSDVGRLNAAAGRPVGVGEDTAEVLEAALRWAAAAPGGFDATLGGGARAGVPLEVDRHRSAPVARLADPALAVDLGGIAKGYAVDLAARALADHGVFHGLVNAGGDLVALGTDGEGEPWRVGVQDPDDPGGVVHTHGLEAGRALATSGTYRRGAHLVDPASGRPLRTPRRSLTVEAGSCMGADAAATALYGAGSGDVPRILARAPARAHIVHSIEGGPSWTST